MSTADREHTSSDIDADLPVENLSPSTLDPKTAEQVRGGADANAGKVHTSDILITKVRDTASTS